MNEKRNFDLIIYPKKLTRKKQTHAIKMRYNNTINKSYIKHIVFFEYVYKKLLM